MSVREKDDPVLFQRIQEQNLLRQYDLLSNCIEIGLKKGIEAFDKYTLWALNYAAVSNIAQFGGRFREEPVYVGDHIPPHFKEVPHLMDQFFSFIHESWTLDGIGDHPTWLAGYALWRLNWIHPFVEGNGRTARAACYYLISLILIHAVPDSSLAVGNAAIDYMCLDRLDDAQDVLAQAQARKVGGESLMQVSYRLAFLRGDEQGMKRLVSAAADEPEAEHNLLGAQAETEAYYGRLQGAREFSRRAQESARRAGNIPMALDYQLESALREVDFSNVSRARRELTPALTHTSGRHLLAALTLARLGDPRAHSLQNELQQRLPLDTLINNYWVPTIEAASALSQNQERRAIELLKKVTPYEFGLPVGTSTVNTVFYPVYLRGQAYLKAGEGAAAETEFQKILGHPGIALNAHVVPLAHLGLARARVLSHDIGGARVAYQDFFALWKDADPDIPIMKQAKAEYAKLQ